MDMEYRHLGRCGLRLSALSLGSWVTFHEQVDQQGAVEMMAAAYDAGVNFFDNAEVYGKGRSEELMGAVFKKLGWRRGSFIVSTKFYWGLHEGVNEKDTLNRKYLLGAIDGSLRRLGLETIDLLFCHRPDPHTPIEETVWAMHNIIQSGKALYWGTSEWAADEIVAAIHIAERHHLHKPVSEQAGYNLFRRKRVEGEYARLLGDYQYGLTTWSPLASGLLTGKYNDGIPAGSRATIERYAWLRERLTDPAALEKVRALGAIAAELGVSLAQMSIAWLLMTPRVSSVITGASRLEQLRDNLGALEALPKLETGVMEQIAVIIGEGED